MPKLQSYIKPQGWINCTSFFLQFASTEHQLWILMGVLPSYLIDEDVYFKKTKLPHVVKSERAQFRIIMVQLQDRFKKRKPIIFLLRITKNINKETAVLASTFRVIKPYDRVKGGFNFNKSPNHRSTRTNRRPHLS